MAVNSVTELVAVATPATGAEAVIATLPVVSSGVKLATGVLIRGSVSPVIGTGATGIQFRCRQGGLAGPQVGQTYSDTAAAGASTNLGLSFNDTTTIPEQAGGVVYVITVQQTGAPSAAGSVTGEITVEI